MFKYHIYLHYIGVNNMNIIYHILQYMYILKMDT